MDHNDVISFYGVKKMLPYKKMISSFIKVNLNKIIEFYSVMQLIVQNLTY